MMHCVHCDTELVAPVRSEYWSDKHACHIWLCPKCCACFSSMVSFPADTSLAHQFRQLGDIRRDPPRLFGEQFSR